MHKKSKNIFSTLFNKTQCVSVICAASADAIRGKRQMARSVLSSMSSREIAICTVAHQEQC